MGRNSAANQKRYRGKKRLDAEWRIREVKRVQCYYIPSADLTTIKLNERRRKGLLSMQKTRARRKLVASTAETPTHSHLQTPVHRIATRACAKAAGDNPTTSASETPSSSQINHASPMELGKQQGLIVKFPFKNSSRKRINHSIMRMKRRLNRTVSEKERLQRTVWCLQKSLQKMKKSKASANNDMDTLDNFQSTPKNASTPMKKAVKLLKSAGISPRKAPLVKRALVLHNSMLKALGHSGKKNCKAIFKSVKHQHNRCATILAKALSISRRCSKKGPETKRSVHSALLRRSVLSFLKRCDNAVCLPGERDVVKVGKELVQKYILNDTLRNLHKKFCLENQNKIISRSLFCKYRPKYMRTVQYLNRKVCLCQKHQNMALKIQAVKHLGFPSHPDNFIRGLPLSEVQTQLQNLTEPNVPYMEWKRTAEPYKQTTIKKTTLNTMTAPRDQFIEIFLSEMAEFAEHAYRVREQYDQIRLLKQTLSTTHVTVQVDFAENYVCNFAEEVQSAYYSKVQVTVHPAVLHFKSQAADHSGSLSDHGAELNHKSMVIVSDETSHTAATIFAFIKKLVPKVKHVIPDVQVIHYLSDSPTSQYRNCNIFNIISLHEQLFGVKATWQYFESGHGKGPCDGVGGAVKRGADLAVKKGELIQTAKELYNWGQRQESQVDYIYVQKDEISSSSLEVTALEAVPVPGTMKIHSVMPVMTDIFVRDTSCFKECCWNRGEFTPVCDGWVRKTVRKQNNDVTKKNTQAEGSLNNSDNTANMEYEHSPKDTDKDQGQSREHETTRVEAAVGCFVVAMYEEKHYIGKVVEYDIADKEYMVTFMEPAINKRNSYKWPTLEDEIWIKEDQILKFITAPTASGKSMRLFKLSEDALQLV